MITDAAHMCIDAVSFMVSLAAIYLAKKRPTQTLSFGYRRAGWKTFLQSESVEIFLQKCLVPC